jgi:hypothetical protein
VHACPKETGTGTHRTAVGAGWNNWWQKKKRLPGQTLNLDQTGRESTGAFAGFHITNHWCVIYLRVRAHLWMNIHTLAIGRCMRLMNPNIQACHTWRLQGERSHARHPVVMPMAGPRSTPSADWSSLACLLNRGSKAAAPKEHWAGRVRAHDGSLKGAWLL